jgi:hypothetical protein
MGVAHPSPIPSFDVQSAAGVGCRSFVTAQIPNRTATGKLGPSPPDRRAPALGEEAAERTFLENHVKTMVSVHFFTVPATRFQILYVFLVLAHERRAA